MKGFSLLDTIIGAALISGLALLLAQMNSNQFKTTRTIETRFDTVSIMNNIQALLSNPTDCLETFGGKSSLTGTATAILVGGNIHYEVDKNIGLQAIRVKNYQLDKLGDPNPETTHLLVTIDRGEKVYSPIVVKSIKMRVQVDASNMITHCVAIGSSWGSSESMWKLAANNQDIFYDSGNVLVGTASASATLQVYGEVKISNTGTSCATSTEGSVRYDSVAKVMAYCDGVNWKVAGGSGVEYETSCVTLRNKEGATLDSKTVLCCRIDKSTGATECKMARRYLGESWSSIWSTSGVEMNPFSASGVLGVYSLSCYLHNSITMNPAGNLVCCRTNATTGSVSCKSLSVSVLGTQFHYWENFPATDPW